MKITAFDDIYGTLVFTGGTTLVSGSSGGSNSGYGGDLAGSAGYQSVVGLRNVVSLASNMGDLTTGNVLTLVSPTTAQFATPSNTASIGSNAMTRTTGGQSTVTTIASSGSAQTLMIGGANTFDITLTANCTLSFTGQAASGTESNVLLILRQDGAGSRLVTWPGSVTWASGSAPTLSTTPSDVDFVVIETVDGGTTWFGFPVGGGGTTSPLTTKGDLWGYSTADVRFAVGSNGTGIIADSTQTLGLRYSLRALSGELLMADGVSAPPVPLETDPGQDDWLYADL
jgi:hypothetical protein